MQVYKIVQNFYGKSLVFFMKLIVYASISYWNQLPHKSISYCNYGYLFILAPSRTPALNYGQTDPTKEPPSSSNAMALFNPKMDYPYGNCSISYIYKNKWVYDHNISTLQV